MTSSSFYRCSVVVAAGVLMATLASAGWAQDPIPSRSLTFVVPQTAGGSNDVLARALATHLVKFLDRPIVVENRPGAGGNIGTASVVKAPNDGSVWLVTGGSAQTINPSLYRAPGFDPIRDFEPVSGIGIVPHLLLVGPSFPAKSLAELLTLAKKNPGRYFYGSAGNGSLSHLLMELMKRSEGVAITHVPFKGVAPAMTELLADRIQILISTLPAALPYVKSGKVKAIAITSSARSRMVPDVPPAPDTVPGMIGEFWVAMYAPRGIAEGAVARMREAISKTLVSPEMAEFLRAQGAEALNLSPKELAALTEKDLRTWGKIIKDAGITVD